MEDIEIPLEDKMGPNMLTKPLAARDIFFIENTGEHPGDWHTAPIRQMIVIIGGELEIELFDGTKRLFVPGDILIAEDTTGRGHINNTKNRKAIVIRLT